MVAAGGRLPAAWAMGAGVLVSDPAPDPAPAASLVSLAEGGAAVVFCPKVIIKVVYICIRVSRSTVRQRCRADTL